MATPDRRDIQPLPELGARAHGLGVVHDEHVSGRKEFLDLLRILRAHSLVEVALRTAKVRVPDTVDEVMQAFGEAEEGGVVRLHHEPICVHAELAHQPEKGRQKLRYPAAMARAVDHDDPAALERRQPALRVLAESPDGGAQRRDALIVSERDRMSWFDGMHHASTLAHRSFGFAKIEACK